MLKTKTRWAAILCYRRKSLEMVGSPVYFMIFILSIFSGLPLKDIQTERHLYNCMALTANALNYSWSRWNLLSGYDKLIMQYREKVHHSENR